MRSAIEGLVMLYGYALDHIREEIKRTSTRTINRVRGPMWDIVVSLKGLQEIVVEDERVHAYL